MQEPSNIYMYGITYLLLHEVIRWIIHIEMNCVVVVGPKNWSKKRAYRFTDTSFPCSEWGGGGGGGGG